MAFVQGYDYDVFVSYAHADNVSFAKGAGWVDMFAQNFKVVLRQVLGREANVWFDKRSIDENRPITPGVLEGVKRAATLLVVMSPSYVESTWCKTEREAFLGVRSDRVANGDVFLVRCVDVEPAARPEPWRDLQGFSFLAVDPETNAPQPLAEQDPTLIKRLFWLCDRMKKQFEIMNKSRPVVASSPVVTAASSQRAVVIGRSTDDLEDRENELRTYLQQLGVESIPLRAYSESSREQFLKELHGDLARSRAFVQLLSTVPGRRPDFSSERRWPVLRWHEAKGKGSPILQWRDRSIVPASVADLEHRALLEGSCACDFEEFKRMVLELATKPDAPAPPPQSRRMVFVDADRHDRVLAKDVCTALKGRGFDCYRPLFEGDPHSLKEDWELNVRDCDGWLLIFGQAGAQWVRRRLQQGNRILSVRPRPLSAQAVLTGGSNDASKDGKDPSTPDDGGLEADIPDLMTIDWTRGRDPARLEGFVASLTR